VTTPRVSIVIPTYQRRDLLEQTLRSVFAQTLQDWECVVVDDGSTDGSREMVHSLAQADPRLRWLGKPHGRPRGPAASRNIGLSATTGRFVLFFDSDDLLPADHLRECCESLEATPADYLVCRIRFFEDGKPEESKDSPPLVQDDFIGRAIAGEHAVFTQNVLWRRSLLERIPPMREDITMVEDLEFAVRAMLVATPPLLRNDLLVLVRRHEQSLTFEPSHERFVQRSQHMYDAYHAIVRSLARHGHRSPLADAYCAARRYNLVVSVPKLGYPSFGSAVRYFHLLAWSIVERRPRPILRLGLLWPVFFGMALVGALRRRSRARG